MSFLAHIRADIISALAGNIILQYYASMSLVFAPVFKIPCPHLVPEIIMIRDNLLKLPGWFVCSDIDNIIFSTRYVCFMNSGNMCFVSSLSAFCTMFLPLSMLYFGYDFNTK